MTGPLAASASELARGAAEVLPRGELERKLALGRPLRVKLGIDPTAPDIHLGHTVVLRKLRDFQDAGHVVVLIIGDFTARVGDPSGRSELRPMLSVEEIEANARTYQEQAFKVLDPDPARLELRRNSEWLDMSMSDLLALVRTTTVGQLLERDDFAKRLKAARAGVGARAALPADAGLRLGGGARGRRARRHRPDLQPPARPRHPARLRAARAGGDDDAAPARRRRQREDVEVARQPHRRDRCAGRHLRAHDVDPRQPAHAVVRAAARAPARRPGRTRSARSARWHAS